MYFSFYLYIWVNCSTWYRVHSFCV